MEKLTVFFTFPSKKKRKIDIIRQITLMRVVNDHILNFSLELVLSKVVMLFFPWTLVCYDQMYDGEIILSLQSNTNTLFSSR